VPGTQPGAPQRFVTHIIIEKPGNFSRPPPFDPPQFVFRKRNRLLRTRNRWFESTSLQRGVRCETEFLCCEHLASGIDQRFLNPLMRVWVFASIDRSVIFSDLPHQNDAQTVGDHIVQEHPDRDRWVGPRGQGRRARYPLRQRDRCDDYGCYGH
jgi:hypothetical protein